MTRASRRRSGFSLIETCISRVIVAFVGASLTKLTTSQLRYFQRLSLEKASRSVGRGTLNVLQNDLRMIEATGGVTSATNATLVVSVPYATGIVCTGSTVSLLPEDSLTYAQAVIGGYAWKDTSAAGVFSYVSTTTAPTAGTVANCTGAGVQITTLPGGSVIQVSPAPGGATTGSPLFLFQTITYELKASVALPGKTALWRTVTGGTADELAVPFDTSARFRYYALDSDTSQITPPAVANIRGVDLQLDAMSENMVSGSSAPSKSKLRTSIFFRNRLN